MLKPKKPSRSVQDSVRPKYRCVLLNPGDIVSQWKILTPLAPGKKDKLLARVFHLGEGRFNMIMTGGISAGVFDADPEKIETAALTHFINFLAQQEKESQKLNQEAKQ